MASKKNFGLIFFTITMIAFSAQAELAAPVDSSPGMPNKGLQPEAKDAEKTPLWQDSLIRSLPKTVFKNSRANAKDCPAGKFLVGNNNSLLVYSKRNEDGVFFGAGEQFLLDEVTDQVNKSIKMAKGSPIPTTCISTTNRWVVQEKDRIEVRTATVEDCDGVINKRGEVLKIEKDVSGKTKVGFDIKSDKASGKNLKCEYLEDSSKRPAPERPSLDLDGKNNANSKKIRTWSI